MTDTNDDTGIMWECTECGHEQLGLFGPNGGSVAAENHSAGDIRDLICPACSEGEWPDRDEEVTEHTAFNHVHGERVDK